MKKHIRVMEAIAAGMAALVSTILFPTPTFATEDGDFSRPIYSLQQVNEGALGDTVTFNSIKIADSDHSWYKEQTGRDLPQGMLRNETNFVGAREDTGVNAGAGNVWEGTDIMAEDGGVYIIRLFVHNDNPNGTNAVAEDTKVRLYIPYEPADEVTVSGWLKSSNAAPEEYLDDVTFKSKDGTPFSLHYISGSALLENGGCADGDGIVLPDGITNQGNPSNDAGDEWMLIGYDSLDGRVPGGYRYANYVSLKVRVVYDYKFTSDTQVRLAGDEEWHDVVDAEIGDLVEFQITYQNTSGSIQNNVKVRNILPSNLHYIGGSTKLKNSSYPDGCDITDGEPSDILNVINIGSYAPGANAKIMFTAEVVNENLADGSNTLYSWGQTGVGAKTLQDDAKVRVQNDKKFIIAATILSLLITACLVAIIVLLKKILRQKQHRNRI